MTPTPSTLPSPPGAPADLLPPEVGSPDADLKDIDRQVKELEWALKRKESGIDNAQMRRQLEVEMKQARIMARHAAELERQARSALADSPTARQLAELERMAREMASRFESQAAAEEHKAEEHSGPSYIDSLESVGLTKLTVDDLISLKVQGVTADYVRQLKVAGFDPNVHDLISMKVQGITPEYIRDIRATGLKPSMHDLIGMKVQCVTPEYIRALQSAGLGDLTIRDFILAKVQGITPEFIEKVRSHGFKNLTFRQLIGLKVADVF